MPLNFTHTPKTHKGITHKQARKHPTRRLSASVSSPQLILFDESIGGRRMKVQLVGRAHHNKCHPLRSHFLHWEYWMSRTRHTRGESVGSRVPTKRLGKKETIVVVLLITIFTCVVPFCLLCNLTRPPPPRRCTMQLISWDKISSQHWGASFKKRQSKMTIILSEITRFAVVSRRFTQAIRVEGTAQ